MNKYLVVHDYQTGGAAFFILADSIEQMVQRFAPPYYDLISEDIDNHHMVKLSADKLLCYDINNLPPDW